MLSSTPRAETRAETTAAVVTVTPFRGGEQPETCVQKIDRVEPLALGGGLGGAILSTLIASFSGVGPAWVVAIALASAATGAAVGLSTAWWPNCSNRKISEAPAPAAATP